MKSKPVFRLKADSEGLKVVKDGKVQPSERSSTVTKLAEFRSKLPRLKESHA